jgi:hypothetical protein
MEAYKRNLMVVMLLCVMFSLFGVAGVANAVLIQLGPDTVPDSPSGSPYVFSNSSGGYGYELEIIPNPTRGPVESWNLPVFTLTNTSTNALAKITSFKFTIGDIDFNFDHLGVAGRDPLGAFSTDLNNDGSFASSLPDNQDNHIRSDFLLYSGFTGFDKGDVFTFWADVDLDGRVFPGSPEDFRTVFWNNGETLNSEITVTFIPEPTTVCLLGLGALSLLRKRRA